MTLQTIRSTFARFLHWESRLSLENQPSRNEIEVLCGSCGLEFTEFRCPACYPEGPYLFQGTIPLSD
jgi:hypothetical protein